MEDIESKTLQSSLAVTRKIKSIIRKIVLKTIAIIKTSKEEEGINIPLVFSNRIIQNKDSSSKEDKVIEVLKDSNINKSKPKKIAAEIQKEKIQ